MFGNLFLKDEIVRELLREGDDEDRQPSGLPTSDPRDREAVDDPPSFLDEQRDVDVEIVTGDADGDR